MANLSEALTTGFASARSADSWTVFATSLQSKSNKFLLPRLILNDDEKQLLRAGDVKCMEDIMLKVGPLLDDIIVYEENLAENTKNKNLIKNGEEICTATLKAKKEFDLIYNKVNEEIEAMEALEDKSDKNSAIERMWNLCSRCQTNEYQR